jgi:hypothetical protein
MIPYIAYHITQFNMGAKMMWSILPVPSIVGYGWGSLDIGWRWDVVGDHYTWVGIIRHWLGSLDVVRDHYRWLGIVLGSLYICRGSFDMGGDHYNYVALGSLDMDGDQLTLGRDH